MPPLPKRGRENDVSTSSIAPTNKGQRTERAAGGAARALAGISTNNSNNNTASIAQSHRAGPTTSSSTARGQPATATARAAADQKYAAMLDTLQQRRYVLQEKANALDALLSTAGPDAIEAMVDGHAEDRTTIRDAPDPLDTDAVLAGLEASQCRTAAAIVSVQEERARMYRALTECEEGATHAASEELVLASEAYDVLLPALQAAQQDKERWDAILRERAAELALEQDSTYGLSAEAAALMRESERLHAHRIKLEKAAAATEVERRLAHATYEELKGTIRVYCRVKGPAEPQHGGPSSISAMMHAEASRSAVPAADGFETEIDDDSTVRRSSSVSFPGHAAGGSVCGADVAGRASSTSSSGCSSTSNSIARMHGGGGGGAARRGVASSQPASPSEHHHLARYTFPDASTDKRTIGIVSSRDNATSTGVRSTLVTNQYDRVFAPHATQGDVFDEVGPLVDCAVDGYRVCILAYGQTGSGKTFTMEGDVRSPQHMGIIPRSVRRMFDRKEALSKDGWTVRFTCYFVEIYNESIRDLLETSESYHKGFFSQEGGHAVRHEITHKGKVDTTITNVKERVVESVDDVQRIIEQSLRNRSVARTALNERSSRSHCVFTIRIEGTHTELRQRSLGNLCLVDLAGSERVHDSGVQGAHLKESVNINKSLSFLGDCIGALSSGAVVPWRNCKLTWLLQNYLGGDGAKVLMLVTVSDREEHVNETINSLRFAAKVNQTVIASAQKRVAVSR